MQNLAPTETDATVDAYYDVNGFLVPVPAPTTRDVTAEDENNADDSQEPVK